MQLKQPMWIECKMKELEQNCKLSPYQNYNIHDWLGSKSQQNIRGRLTSLTWKYVPLSGKLPLIAVLQGIWCKSIQILVSNWYLSTFAAFNCYLYIISSDISHQNCPSDCLWISFSHAITWKARLIVTQFAWFLGATTSFRWLNWICSFS